MLCGGSACATGKEKIIVSIVKPMAPFVTNHRCTLTDTCRLFVLLFFLSFPSRQNRNKTTRSSVHTRALHHISCNSKHEVLLSGLHSHTAVWSTGVLDRMYRTTEAGTPLSPPPSGENNMEGREG